MVSTALDLKKRSLSPHIGNPDVRLRQQSRRNMKENFLCDFTDVIRLQIEVIFKIYELKLLSFGWGLNSGFSFGSVVLIYYCYTNVQYI
jgi:hypothetical protein